MSAGGEKQFAQVAGLGFRFGGTSTPPANNFL
jgi:hypothetical protein